MRGVSIIMPVFNTPADQLMAAVASAHGQGLQANEFEILVVDDGSTNPETLDMLGQLGSYQNVRVLRQENAGPSAARNLALREAKFEFCTGLDSDDFYINLHDDPRKIFGSKKSYLQQAMSALDAQDSLGFVYCDYYAFDEKHQFRHERRQLFDPQKSFVLGYAGVFFVCRTEDLRSAGGFPEQFTGGEDWLALLGLQNHLMRSGRKCEAFLLRTPHYCYRQHTHGRNVDAQPRNYNEIYEFIVQQYPEICQAYYGHVPRERLVGALTGECQREQGFSDKLLYACRDPIWGVKGMGPFIRRLFHAAVFEVESSIKGLFAKASQPSPHKTTPPAPGAEGGDSRPGNGL